MIIIAKLYLAMHKLQQKKIHPMADKGLGEDKTGI